MKKTLN